MFVWLKEEAQASCMREAGRRREGLKDGRAGWNHLARTSTLTPATFDLAGAKHTESGQLQPSPIKERAARKASLPS